MKPKKKYIRLKSLCLLFSLLLLVMTAGHLAYSASQSYLLFDYSEKGETTNMRHFFPNNSVTEDSATYTVKVRGLETPVMASYFYKNLQQRSKNLSVSTTGYNALITLPYGVDYRDGKYVTPFGIMFFAHIAITAAVMVILIYIALALFRSIDRMTIKSVKLIRWAGALMIADYIVYFFMYDYKAMMLRKFLTENNCTVSEGASLDFIMIAVIIFLFIFAEITAILIRANDENRMTI